MLVIKYAFELRPVFIGFPQGSVLGPFIFAVYANNTLNVISCVTTFPFADDIKKFQISEPIPVNSNADGNTKSWVSLAAGIQRGA